MEKRDRKLPEVIFELSLWNSRFLVLSAVIFGLVGATILFMVASADVFEVTISTFEYYFGHSEEHHLHELVVGKIIGAVDLYLIAVVLMIFSFGIYELFISDIEPAKNTPSGSSKILEIHSLDELKDKLGKVIVMVLVVSFFQRVLSMEYSQPVEMLYFAISIFALAMSLYFLHKH